MIGLAPRAALRLARRHPWQAGSAVAGIALGTAVASGMGTAVESARDAFALSQRAVAGHATHVVEGGPQGLPESLYPALRRRGLGVRAAPIVSDYVTARPADEGGGTPRVLLLVGIDPVADRYFRAFARGGPVLMSRPGAAVLAASTARALGAAAPGGRFRVEAGGRTHELALAATLPEEDAFARAALAGLLVTDIATAQEVLDARGRLSRIDLVLEGDPERVRAALPAGAFLAPAGARARAAAEMTRAFEFNLRMLSLLALVVAGLLVYNAVTFLVLQRRETLGVLRALGATRGELFRGVLAEAAVLGALGGAAGGALGAALADGLTRLVLRTVNDLYFVTAMQGAPAGAGPAAAAAALGAGAAVLAALPAAREAAAVWPWPAMRRSHVEARVRRFARRGLAAAAVCAAFAGFTLWSGRYGYAGLAAALAAGALAAPAAVRIGALRGLGRLPPLVRLAARSVAGGASRTGVAAAALAIALAALVGVSVMVESFRGEVEAWLGDALDADFYVSRPAAGGRAGVGGHRLIEPALADRLAAAPGVREAGRRFRTRVRSGEGEVRVAVLDSRRDPGYRLASGGAAPAAVWRRFREEDAVLVSEPFAARRAGVAAGEGIRLRTPGGERRFEVAGVYRDFASEHGFVLMSAATWARHWGPPPVHSLALALDGAAGAADTAARLAAAAGPAGLEVRSAGELRAASLAVFDRTFRVTEVLRWLAALAAGAAVLGTLLAVGLERAPELALLRALGLTRRGLFFLVGTEGALVGAVAGALSAPLGVVLAAILVHVVNRQAFGWSMALEVAPLRLAEPVALAIATGLAAGLWPAWRAARSAPAPERDR